MKRLMIMRHAEAEDLESGQTDKRRMLSRKGRQDMSRLHTLLLAEALMPQFALASDANRTQTTLMEVTGHGFEGDVEFTPELYNAEGKKIIETAQLLNDQYDSALIVAHSPGVYEAVMNLVNEMGRLDLYKKLGSNYRSGTLTIFECPIDKWADLSLRKNKLARLLIPD